jgi:hypothetical protein
MCDPRHSFQIDEAFGAIEESILPSISTLLDALLDTASHARAGVDAEVHAAELRTLGLQLQQLTAQVEAICPVRGAHWPVLELNISA